MKRITACVIILALALSLISVGGAAAATKKTIYQEGNLLYWRFDGGKDEQTIIIKTDNLPINNTYTEKIVDGPVPAYANGVTYYRDTNPGSDKNYGDTLLNAGVVEQYTNNTEIIHRNPIDKNDSSLFTLWGSAAANPNPGATTLPTDDSGRIIYDYNLPGLMVEDDLLTYKISYEGNAILVPMNSITYYTDVQGKLVKVESDDNIKLQYAIEKQGVGAESAKWILGTNTTTVRLEADYTYTRLVPATEGYYREKYFGYWVDYINTTGGGSDSRHRLTRTDKYDKDTVTDVSNGTHYGTSHYPASNLGGDLSWTVGLNYYSEFHRSTSRYTEQGTDYGQYGFTGINDYPVLNYGYTSPSNTSTGSYYEDYAQFRTTVKDYINNRDFVAIANCPVTSVKETVHYYIDVPCYVINTDMVKGEERDKNIYIKDYLRDYIAVEEYHFTKNKGNFSVKYKYGTGFAVTGITRNTDLKWINGTHISEAISGYDGELIEWWPGQSSVHYYTTPDNINKDIDVSLYMDYGVTLYFLDANKPIKVAKVKIPARSKAPLLKPDEKGADILLKGLKTGTTAIRLANTDGTYMAMPESAKGYFSSNTYLLDGDAKNENKEFYIYNSDKKVDVMTLFGMTDNKNFNNLKGAYIEAQTIGKGSTIPSGVSALYVNEQRVFNTGSSSEHESIILGKGTLYIADADGNNVYEYCLPKENGEPTEWKKIKTAKVQNVKELTEGKTIYIRKASFDTKDQVYHLPSTYISLTYNGGDNNLPNAYYMDDYYVEGTTAVKIINNTPRPQVMIGSTVTAPGDSVSLGQLDTIYKMYIEGGDLVTGLNENMCLVIKAGEKVVTLEEIDNVEINFTDLLDKLESKYGNEWTNAYSKYGITSITYGEIPDYRKVTITATRADDVRYTLYTETSDGTKLEYHPVHLLRYMLQ